MVATVASTRVPQRKKKQPRMNDIFRLWLRKPNTFKPHALTLSCALPQTTASRLSLLLPCLEN